MTSSNRVDASSPFLDELRTYASKGFDGSISAAANGLEVIVYLEAEQVIAVYSPQFTFPTHELAVAYTGIEPTGEDHLRWLYERINSDTEGKGLGADDVDRIVRNWSYGLLASALTWRNPKVRRNRKATVATNKFYPTPWQVVLADVTARVDDLVSSWAILTDYLAAHEDFAGGARPASVACSKLVLQAPGHPLLVGKAPVDEVARTLGTTRHELLSAAARVLLSGGTLQPALMATSGGLPVYPVPESLEDPSNEWASIEAVAEVERPAVEAPPEDVVEAEAEPELEPQTEQHDADLDDVYAELGVEVVEPDLSVPEPAVETLTDNPLEGAVEVAHVTDVALAEDALSSSGAAQMRTWVDASVNDRERALRESVYQQALVAAAAEASTRLGELESKIIELEAKAADAQTGQQEVEAAAAEADAARAQVEVAETRLRAIEAEGLVYLAAERSVQQQLEQARDHAVQAQDDVEAAQRALAAAQESLQAAQAHVAHTESELDSVSQDAQAQYHLPLALAVEGRDEVTRTVLEPAQARLDRVSAEVVLVSQAATDLVDEVMTVGYEAELGLRVVRDLDDTGQVDSDPLVASLRTLHERLTAVLDGMPELTGQPAATATSQVPVEQAEAPAVDGSIDSALEDLLVGHDTDVGLDEVEQEPLMHHADELAQVEEFTEVPQATFDQLEADPVLADISAGLALSADPVEGAADSDAVDAFEQVLADLDDSGESDELDDILDQVAGTTAGQTEVMPVEDAPQVTFDEILADQAPEPTWNGAVVQWASVEAEHS